MYCSLLLSGGNREGKNSCSSAYEQPVHKKWDPFKTLFLSNLLPQDLNTHTHVTQNKFTPINAIILINGVRENCFPQLHTNAIWKTTVNVNALSCFSSSSITFLLLKNSRHMLILYHLYRMCYGVLLTD